MKTRLIIFSAVVASIFALTSCMGKSQGTPYFDAAQKFYRTTLSGRTDTIWATDSLNVGDTVRWNLFVSGGVVNNTLTSFSVKTDTSALQVSLEADSALLNNFATGTDLEHAQIVFQPQQLYYVTLWLKFVTRKSDAHHIEFVVANDAGNEYSPRSWGYTAKVK